MRYCASTWFGTGLLVLVLITMGGCGQTGELYYPEPPEEEAKKTK